MYESLKKYSDDFHLFIFAFDDISFQILKEIKLQHATIISLNEFETADLLDVKIQRSIAEYCWTCTPATISFVLQNYDVMNCTYVDSDLIFYSDPAVLIEEMVEHHKNVLITEHRYSPLAKIYEEKRAGRFCVQFVTFTKEADSLAVLEKWRSQCIEWCYARHEDGKYGDQKYLDEWPLIYKNVHILEHPGGGVAPWNLLQYRFRSDGISIRGIVKKTGLEFNMVFFHFQYVKFLEDGYYDVGWYLIPQLIKQIFYLPYLQEVEDLESRIQMLNTSYHKSFTKFTAESVKSFLKIEFKSVFAYNIIKKNKNGFSNKS
jgi:hypothetical protein